MERYFQISLHALIFSAFGALALTGRLDLPSILIFTVGVGLSLYRVVKGRTTLLSAQAVFYLSCVYIVFFLLDSLRSFVPAAVHLVLFLELAKLHQRSKNEKDYLYLIILAFLKILAASSLTIGISFVATLLLFLIALVSTMMSYNMRRFQAASRMEDRKIAASIGGMSVWATFCIVVLGAILFLLIPRADMGYFSQSSPASILLSGFTDNVQLGEIGQVKLNSAVVMRARRLFGARSAVLKWRGIALDAFDGRKWYRSDRTRTFVERSGDEYFVRSRDRMGDLARYDIFLEPLPTTTLFGPHRIVAIYGSLPSVEVDRDESLFTRFRPLQRTEYEVLSEVPNPRFHANPIAADSPIPPDIQAKYLQLPDKLDPRVRQLASEITQPGSSSREKASIVEAYLKRNYKYTLNLTWKPGEQPVSTFLLETKAGHCEYFASAMAILLRASGVPTRMVNGFLMGEYNPVGDDYIVRQSDAHSWVEVFTSDSGWVEFDPTPPDPNQKEVGLGRQLSHYVDAMELFWNSYVLTYDTGSQLQLFRNAQDRVENFQEGVQTSSYDWAQRIQQLSDRFAHAARTVVEAVWFWILVILAAGGATIYRHRLLLRTEWRVWRARTVEGPVDEQVVEHLFYRAARLAAGRKHPRRPGQTWREWVIALPDPARQSILAPALDVFERSKYGSQPASSSDFAVLESAIRGLRGP